MRKSIFNNCKVSVIVPVYNAERYLHKCIESIQNQTLKEIEIILVNDGSTDNSLSICLDYAKKDKRVVIIDKINNGVSSARNAGIEIAKGEYISFIDADDWIEPEMYEAMYNQIKSDQSNVCICNYVEERNGSTKLVSLNLPTNKDVLVKPEIIKHLILNMIGPESANSNSQTIMGCVWRLLIDKNLLVRNNILFPLGIPVMEDLIFCIDLLLKSEKVSINRGFYYHYIIHIGSATSSYREDFDKIQLEVFSHIERALFSHNVYDMAKNRLNIRYINMCISNIVNEIHKDNHTKNLFAKFRTVDKYCKDKKLRDILSSIDFKCYTFRKKTVLIAFKHGISLYIFIYYFILDRIMKRILIEKY